jgi:hypothetical protein
MQLNKKASDMLKSSSASLKLCNMCGHVILKGVGKGNSTAELLYAKLL